MGKETARTRTGGERQTSDNTILKHQPYEYKGRRYNFDPNCDCAGCISLRKYPEPAVCDWCKQSHCGGPDHCSTEELCTDGGVRGADQTSSTISEGYLEDVCDVIRDRIKQITTTVKELNENMIPRYQGQTTTEEVQSAPQQRRGGNRRGNNNRQRDGHNYLNWEDIGNGTRPGKILACRVQPDSFDKSQTSVVCKVTVDGKIFIYTLRLNNPNLETLQNAWGFDENDWVDKKVTWSTEEDEVTGRHNIRVEPAEETKKGKK